MSSTKLYTREEAAKALGRHPELVGKWLRDRTIKAAKVFGVWVIPQSEVTRMTFAPIQRRRSFLNARRSFAKKGRSR